jgi:hypothetical protein
MQCTSIHASSLGTPPLQYNLTCRHPHSSSPTLHSPTRTHTRARTRAHTHTHTQTHAHTRTLAAPCPPIKHAYMPPLLLLCSLAMPYLETQNKTHAHTHAPRPPLACSHARMHARAQERTRTHTYTHTHTCTHTHTHTHTHIACWPASLHSVPPAARASSKLLARPTHRTDRPPIQRREGRQRVIGSHTRENETVSVSRDRACEEWGRRAPDKGVHPEPAAPP